MSAIMAPHLRLSEAATSGLRRLLIENLDASLLLLAERPIDTDATHALRRNLKRCRATLLLLRSTLGKAAWRREEATLRTAARALGTLRDRQVLHNTVGSLAEKSADPQFSAFTRAIKRETDDGDTPLPAPLARSCRTRLASARTRLRARQLPRRNWSILGPELRRTYKRARRAQAVACATGSDESLHLWRRRTKTLCHQLELIEHAAPDIRASVVRLRALADLLGRYHDLVLVREKVRVSVSLVSAPEGGARYLAQLATALTALRREANALGAPQFADTSREFEKQLRTHWRRWRALQASSASRR